MGRDKAGLQHPCGTTFLEHALERLRDHCHSLCVSLSVDQSPPIPLSDALLLRDPVAHCGPMVGVAKALELAQRLQYDGCFVTPVDMPDLSSEDLKLIHDQWFQSSDQIVCAVNSDSGMFEPLVAIYPTTLARSLAITVASEDRSLYRWIQRGGALPLPLAPSATRNVNSPDDLCQ